MRKSQAGYSLVELIMAMGMAGLVLFAVVYISASMIRFAVQGSTRSDLSAWTVFSLSNMNKEIENATYFVTSGGTLTSDVLNGCSNWAMDWASDGVGGQLDTSNPITSFYYGICQMETSPPVQVLVRCAKTGVCPYDSPLPSAVPSPPPAPAPSCVDPPPAGCSVVGRHIYKQRPASDYYFTITAAQPNVVEIHYTVGVATGNIIGSAKAPTQIAGGAGLHTPTPQFLKVDSKIRFNNPYANPMIP